MKKIIIVFLLLSFISCDKNIKESKGVYFEYSSGKNKVFLLGSIHFGNETLYPIEKKIIENYKKSEALFVEVDIKNINYLKMQSLLKKCYYKNDKTLQSELKSDLLFKLKKELGKIGLPFESIKKFRPFFLAMTMTALKAKKLGYSEKNGIDLYFLNKAYDDGKKIIELESAESQINLLSSLFRKDEEKFLEKTLEELVLLDKFFIRLIDSWKKGDNKNIEKLIIDSYKDHKLFYDKILKNRNEEMAKKIKELSRKYKYSFVVVGAAHLIGKDSIVNILLKNKNQ